MVAPRGHGRSSVLTVLRLVMRRRLLLLRRPPLVRAAILLLLLLLELRLLLLQEFRVLLLQCLQRLRAGSEREDRERLRSLARTQRGTHSEALAK